MSSNVIHLNVELEAREHRRKLTPKQETTIRLRDCYATGTRLLLNDLLIAYRDSDGQVYAVRKGMNTEAEAMLENLGFIEK